MTDINVRLTHQTLRVLRIFVDNPSQSISGADIWREARILSGTLYPILARLEKAEWLTSEWEKVNPSEIGRPAKRLYRITALGQTKAMRALYELLPNEGKLAWSS